MQSRTFGRALAVVKNMSYRYNGSTTILGNFEVSPRGYPEPTDR
jgi:hypothetical protein